MRLRIPALCLGLVVTAACDQPLLQKIHSIQPPNTTALAPPEALRDVAITAAGPGQLHLAFDDTNTVKTGYRVSRRQAGTADFAEVALVQVSTLGDPAHPGYTDTVTPGQAYDYQVEVVNDFGDSPAVTKTWVYGPVAPVLAWSAAPHIEATCRLRLDGTVTTDPHWSTPVASTTGALALASGVTGDSSGLSATVTPTTTGTGTATWVVRDGVGETSLVRDLTFSVQAVSLMQPDIPTRTAAGIDGEGMQPIWPTCANCTAGGRRGQVSHGHRIGMLLGTDGTLSSWTTVSPALGNGVGTYYANPQTACATASAGAPCLAITSPVTSIAIGNYHGCAVIGGVVHCWGANDHQQVVATTEAQVVFPRPVCATPGPGCTPLQAVAVTAGDYFSCALLSANGKVQCWGTNAYGELGNGTSADPSGPSDVCESMTGGTCNALAGVDALSTMDSTTCAVMHTGEVRCWGYNAYGQVGDGTFDTALVATSVCASGTGAGCTPLTGASAVAVGDYFACAVTGTAPGNGVQCWGYASNGRLGVADATVSVDPSPPVAVCDGIFPNGPCPTPLTHVAPGTHSLVAGLAFACALRDDGHVVCWGSDSTGHLGDGTDTTSEAAAEVCTSGANDGTGHCSGAALAGVTALSSGAGYTCALGAAGAVACWGGGMYDRLGRGPASTSDTYLALPVCASGADATCVPQTAATLVATGEDQACLADASGLKCWGTNVYGELAIGAPDLAPLPAPVCASGRNFDCTPLSGVISVSAGWDIACAALDDGSARCWGRQYTGELGNGQWNGMVATPTAVCTSAQCTTHLTGATQVAVGYEFACALLSSGQVSCWGSDACGQLGSGGAASCPDTSQGANLAQPVCRSGSGSACVPFDHAVSIAAAAESVCALTDAGRVYCWGRDDYGQTGAGLPATAGFTDRPMPVCAKGDSTACQPPPPIVAITAGHWHFCGLTATGQVYCWGDNYSSQLGDGTPNGTLDVRNTAALVCDSGSGAACTPLTGAVGVAAGMAHTCALLADGSVKCWGRPSYVGAAGVAAADSPVAVCAPDAAATCTSTCANGALGGVVAISAGGTETCAVATDGAVRCWGDPSATWSSDPFPCVPTRMCSGGGTGDACTGGAAVTAAALTCNHLEVTSP